METVYIVAIVAVAAVLVGVIWLLRDRITAGHFGASASEKRVEAGFKASPPRQGKEPARPAPPENEKLPSVDISDNVMIGVNVIHVWRRSVRVVRNWLLGKQKIEAGTGSRGSPTYQKERKDKKRRV